jgi:hypothetical protein
MDEHNSLSWEPRMTRFSRYVAIAGAVGIASVMLGVVLVASLSSTKTTKATIVGAHDGEPRTEEEKAVAKYLEPFYPKPIRWIRWGPHDLEEKTHFHGNKVKAIRVRFQFTSVPNSNDRVPITTTEDFICYVKPDHNMPNVPITPTVFRYVGNENGDRWLDAKKRWKREIQEANERERNQQ